MKKSFFAVMLAFVMVIAVTASCGGSGSGSSGSGSSSAAADLSNVARKDPYMKHSPEVSVKMVASDISYVVVFEDGDDMENNDWTRAYKDELGVNVDFMWISDASQYDTRIEMMLASGDLADIFPVKGVNFQQLYENGLIEDLSVAYLEFISDDAKRLITEAGPYAVDACTRDGRLMALPHTGNQIENIPLLGIRTDWLDNLNLSMPTTYQELEDVLIAFATQDPDGNGIDDTFNFMLEKNSFTNDSDANGFFFMFDAWPGTWVDDGGKLVWGGVQPNCKEALAALKRLYDSGAINKEFPTFDYAKAIEYVTAGKVGAQITGYYGSSSSNTGYVKSTGNVDFWTSVALPSATSNKNKLAYGTEPYNYHVVKKGYANPEIAVQMMNMFINEFYINTMPNERYLRLVQNEVGTNPKWNLSLCQAYRPANNINNFRLLSKWHETGDQSYYDSVTALGKTFYAGGIEYRDTGNLDQWFWWLMHCPEYESPSMAITSKNIADGNLQPNLFYGAPTETMTERWNTLWDRQVLAYQNIVTGGPIDDFDKFVAEWRSMGGDAIEREVNLWYEDHKNADDIIFVR